jgi:uncharacterized protein
VALTPIVPSDRQVIERYAPSGFRISGVIYHGPVLVFPDRTLTWAPASAAYVTWDSLLPVVEHGGVQILLLGFGDRTGLVPGTLRSALRATGITIEPMSTGAACRTYNILLAEDRRVAAALMPTS